MASVRNRYEIACPKCRKAGTVEMYEVADAGDEPGLRTALVTDQLNLVECGHCKFRFRVNKLLVYRDTAHGICVAWAPNGDETPAEAIDAAVKLSGSDPALQVVFERVDLVERVFLLEAGLDARLVEYVKYLVFSNNAKQVDPAQKRLLFNAQDSTEAHLSFVIQDRATRQLESLLHYSREAYRGIEEMFGGETGRTRLNELFPGPAFSALNLMD